MNKILIADDSRLVIALVKNIFEKLGEGYIVISASDGREAVEKTVSDNPDLILMDWQMPVMTGLEALVELKANKNTKDIPVIMLTASDSVASAFDHGASDFIQKPFDKPELLARVKSSLDVVNASKELKRRNIEIEIQREKLKLQKDLLVKQKREITEYNILAGNIQSDLISNEDRIVNYFRDSFLLTLPKDNIFNNFLWISKKNTTIFFAVAYCSRHGLSSLLINLYSNYALDEILSKANDVKQLQPAQMLNAYQNKIDRVVCVSDTQRNCVDIAICAFDLEKNTLQYAGANVPVYVIKNKKLVELKTDNLSLIKKGENQFTNHKVQLASDDLVYLLNDGFNEHQIEMEGKNYLSEEISKVLMKIYMKDMAKQNELLLKTFNNWKNDLKQVEDILVIGIKV